MYQSVDDDVPYAVLGLSANESLGTEASAQKVDTSESLPALNCVRAHARLERAEDIPLSSLAHGLILTTLGCLAKVVVDGDQDILDGDERVARGVSGIWKDCEQPGEGTNAKGKGGQGRVRSGRREDGRGEVWVGMRGLEPYIVP